MKPLRLLLVDDDPGLRALLRATFEVVDMDVAEAESAEEAAAYVGASVRTWSCSTSRCPGKVVSPTVAS